MAELQAITAGMHPPLRFNWSLVEEAGYYVELITDNDERAGIYFITPYAGGIGVRVGITDSIGNSHRSYYIC